MLPRHAISDEHWERIKDFLPGQEGDPGVTARPTHLTRLADNDLRLPQLRSPGKLAV
jgi:transposase